MIVLYDSHAIEVAVKKTQNKQVHKVVRSLRSKYPTTITPILELFPRGRLAVDKRSAAAQEWLLNPQGDFILEVFSLSKDSSPLIVMALSQLKHLGTDFGKKYKGKSVAYLTTWSFGTSQKDLDHINEFHSTTARFAGKHFEVEKTIPVTSVRLVNKTYDKLKRKKHFNEAVPVELVDTLNTLKNRVFRQVILRARQAKDPTARNIAESTGLPVSKVRPILNRAVKIELLVREYNVVCRKCSAVLARVPYKDSIAKMAEEAVTCAKCKTPVKPSSFGICYIANPKMQKFLDGSRWMAIYVQQSLKKVGIYSSTIEVIDGPNELDVIANCDGSLVLMELKDGPFSIGHAYSFVGKCSQYKPEIAVIVAAEGVDKAVKDYLRNTEIKATFIDRLEDLDIRLSQLFGKFHQDKFIRLSREISWDSMLSDAFLSTMGVSVPSPDPRGYWNIGATSGRSTYYLD